PVRRVQTDNGTEFVNQTLRDYYEEVGISHEISVARSPQQNGVIKRHNRTLIEAARTMLIYAQAPLFLWAEAVATTCFTQNRSIIRLRHEKTPYELLHSKLHDLSFFHVFGALCYPTNDSENLGLVRTSSPSTSYVPPSRNDWDLLFQPMFDELLNPPPSVVNQAPEVIAPITEVIPPVHADSTGSPSSTTVDQDAPSSSKTHTITEIQSSVIPQDVRDDNLDMEVAHIGNDLLLGVPIPEVTFAQSSSTASPQSIVKTNHPMPHHNSKWTKDHPLNNIIGQLSRPQELNEFERLEVWELVPRPDQVMVITLKWIYKTAFLNGNLREEVYVSQPDGFVDPDNPNHVGIFINQSKYAIESLKKYGFESCDPVDTPMVEKSKLDEDREGKAVDPSHYRVSGLAYRKARTCSQKDLSIPTWNRSSRTMATTIEQQVALDKALVPSTQRCPFFKAFLITADVPEIYMQEFWATPYVHQHSIKFKLDNKKHIVNLETFRDMLHICPRIPGQSFDELPFKEEILEFLSHGDPFGAVINKCLTGKSSGFESFRLSQAQILWGLYHSRNIDYAFLIWEDFVYQIEHKNNKRINEMYYPRFTKVIIHHFMSKDLSIPK
nr:retrovirus-related Pol polyprotein from transposon TNT 1-94 [Tanacetum cinerariifolium]